LHFESEEVHRRYAVADLEIWKGEGRDGRLFFAHPNVPGWSVYTFDERILRLAVLLQLTNTRTQIEENQKSRANCGDALSSRDGSLDGRRHNHPDLCPERYHGSFLVARIPPEFDQEVGGRGIAELKQTNVLSTTRF
jgi:hypothetical protein